jgi:hypothetical protein
MKRRAALKVEQPDLNNKDIIRKMGEEWKAMTKEDKVPYEQLAADDKIRNQNEKALYEANKSKNGESNATKSPSKKADSAKAPKKATPVKKVEKKKEESEHEDEDDDEEDNDDEDDDEEDADEDDE